MLAPTGPFRAGATFDLRSSFRASSQPDSLRNALQGGSDHVGAIARVTTDTGIQQLINVCCLKSAARSAPNRQD
jgi:hypothetical protein